MGRGYAGRASAKPLIKAIEKRGGLPIALPLLEIVDAEDGGIELGVALANLGPDDWLVVLSPNGARRVLAHAPNFDASTRPNLAVIASGTEKVFADVGLTADLIAEIASSVGLLASFEHVELDGRVLIAQAKNGRTELLEGLTARGIDVESIAAYQNVMPELDPEAVSYTHLTLPTTPYV